MLLGLKLEKLVLVGPPVVVLWNLIIILPKAAVVLYPPPLPGLLLCISYVNGVVSIPISIVKSYSWDVGLLFPAFAGEG